MSKRKCSSAVSNSVKLNYPHNSCNDGSSFVDTLRKIEENWIKVIINFYNSEKKIVRGFEFFFYKTSKEKEKRGVYFHFPDTMEKESFCIFNKSFISVLEFFVYFIYSSIKDSEKSIVNCKLISDNKEFKNFISIVTNKRDYLFYSLFTKSVLEFFGEYKSVSKDFVTNLYSLINWVKKRENNHELKNNVIIFKSK